MFVLGVLLGGVRENTDQKTPNTGTFHAVLFWSCLFCLVYSTCTYDSNMFRSSRPVMFYYVKFTGKRLRWSLFPANLQTCNPETVLKRDSSMDVFFWILQNVYDHLFYRTLLTDCFWCIYDSIMFLVDMTRLHF